ncbi:MAG: hypothetical protein JSV56_05680, partial [Methanomassiliicoccales archaeon]
AFLSNELIEDEIIVNLYERKEPFHNLSDEQWYELLWYSYDNRRISTPYSETWMDGYDEYLYGRVFSAGWKLFEKLPVNKKTARLLAHLGERLVPDAPHDMEVMDTICRWKVETDPDELDVFGLCRYALANLIRDFKDSFESMKDSDDIALRQSYYRRFTAYRPEEIRELFEKDNDKFLEEATENLNLYKNENIRDELRKCCWDYKDPHSDLLYPNMFNSRVDLLEKQHPEWFKDWEDDIPLDKVEDPLVRANKYLEHINRKLKIISEKLSDPRDEDHANLFDEIKNISNQLNVSFSTVSVKKFYYWLWGIAGLVLGYLLAK